MTNRMLIPALLGLLTSGFVYGQAKTDDKFLFLHLQLKDGVITLIKSAAVPGVLKPQRRLDKPGAFQFDAESAAGVSLWSGAMNDPSIRRYEYADPDNPGAIKAKVVQLNQVEFTVRLPILKEAHHLSFYRMEAAPANAFAAPGAKSTPLTKALIARIQLPAGDNP